MSPLDAALRYAKRGWRVLPVHAFGAGRGCSCERPCGSPGKHPLLSRGVRDAETAVPAIRRWWAQWPWANVAIATGAGSGLVVIDLDPRHGGDAGLLELVAKHGALPETLTVQTGSGGRHWYLAHPGGHVGNRAHVFPGIDVRGDGGYVLAPPSGHVSGGRYRWLGPAPLATAPSWLVTAAPIACPPPPLLPEDQQTVMYRRMQAWLERTDRSVQGYGGSAALMKVLAKVCAQGLSADAEWSLACWYGIEHSDPPWSKQELVRALENARLGGRGQRLAERK